MDRIYEEQWSFREGDDIYGSDGEKVGSVIAVEPNYVVVEKGFFFPTDYYIPMSAIATHEEGRLYLNISKDEALNQGWGAEPSGDATGGYVADRDYGADIGRSETGTNLAAAESAMGETARVEPGEVISVPVHEEELAATTRERELGQVRVEKDVVAEEQVLEVPVTEERVHVERRVVDRPVGADDATAFQEGAIEVPIRGEEVDVQKQTRVAEEIEIGKEAVQRTEQVSGTVRREEVRVDEDVTQDVRRGEEPVQGARRGRRSRGEGRG